MRTASFLSVVRDAWNDFDANRPIRCVVDVSVHVSTNHVYRIDLESGDHLFAKLSYFGTYRHFREDHTIIHRLGQALPSPYRDFLARSYLQDGEIYTYHHVGLGEDVWVVFYRPVVIGRRLPRKLEARHVGDLGRELARFHRACSQVTSHLPGFSKIMRYDIDALLALLDSDQGRCEYGHQTDLIRRHCELYLTGLSRDGYENLPAIPVFVDWNIGNFSLSPEGRFLSRWDYDWFRVSSRVLDFYFFSRVVSAGGDQTVFSYVIDTFLDDRFLDFLRAYHEEFPLTEAEIRFLPEAYRFFILNYVVKYGQHFFHDIYASRLQREAYETYLPQIGRLDVERLLRALSL
jgi:Ser/Thr protein kinase RdoA (MazF antagonist)